MRTACVTLFVVVVAMGLSACLGQDWDDFNDDVFDDDNYYGVQQFSSGYPMGNGGGFGGGYVGGNGGGYQYAVPLPMYMPPPPAMSVGGFGGDGLFGQNNGLIFLLLLLPFLLSNSNGGLLG